MLKKIAFSMYPVKDPQRARAFYTEILGLKMGLHSADGVWTEFDLPGGGCLALFGAGGEPSAEAGGSVALEVEDLDALTQELTAKGVRFRGDLIHSPVCRMRVMLDSEGNALILHQLKAKD